MGAAANDNHEQLPSLQSQNTNEVDAGPVTPRAQPAADVGFKSQDEQPTDTGSGISTDGQIHDISQEARRNSDGKQEHGIDNTNQAPQQRNGSNGTEGGAVHNVERLR